MNGQSYPIPEVLKRRKNIQRRVLLKRTVTQDDIMVAMEVFMESAPVVTVGDLARFLFPKENCAFKTPNYRWVNFHLNKLRAKGKVKCEMRGVMGFWSLNHAKPVQKALRELAPVPPPEPVPPTFLQVAEAYIMDRHGEARESSHGYRVKDACAPLSGFLITDITEAEIKNALEYFQANRRHKKPLCKKTLRIRVVFYFQVFEFAKKEGYIKKNPCRKLVGEGKPRKIRPYQKGRYRESQPGGWWTRFKSWLMGKRNGR